MDKPGSHSGSYPVFAPNLSSAKQLNAHPIRRRLHDRYVMSRFPALTEPRQDLRDTNAIIRYARELFDDEEPRRAIELLSIAIEEDQSQRALWLALIELCFIVRDATRFTELILAFSVEFALDLDLPTLGAMRHDLTPDDPSTANAPRLLELPNWSMPTDGSKNEALQKQLHSRLQQATILRVNQ